MPCIKIGNAIVTYQHGYKYKGFYFEWHYFCGPMKINKDGEPAKKTGLKFYKIATEWNKLSKEEKEKTRI